MNTEKMSKAVKNMAAEKTKQKSIALSEINPKNLVELNGWETKQTEIVASCPFVEVTNTETYEVAKQHRTALRTARTTLQNQEKEIARVIKGFRTAVKVETQRLIDITLPHEEKQQEEVSKYEAGIEQRRREKEEKEEQERLRNMQLVTDAGKQLREIVNRINYDNRTELEVEFMNAKNFLIENTEIDLIYEAFLQDEIAEAEEMFWSYYKQVEEAELMRVENEQREEYNLLTQLGATATDIIYESDYENRDKIKPRLKKLFSGHEFKHYPDKLESLIEDAHMRAVKQIDRLAEHEDAKQQIQKLNQEKLDREEQEQKRLAAERKAKEEEELKNRTADRQFQLENYGMVVDEKGDYHYKEGENIAAVLSHEILSSDKSTWEATLDAVRAAIQAHKSELKRTKKYKADRTKMIAAVKGLKLPEIELENAEMKKVWKQVELELGDYIVSMRRMIER